MSYADFIDKKLSTIPPTGLTDFTISGGLFPHQSSLVNWALKRGCACVFADTGLGKSRIQIAWADAIHRETGHDVIILAPLAVAAQTVREGAEMGITVNHCRELHEVKTGITITNYDRIHKFDCSRFGAVVLDESSIIKHHDSKTLKTLLDSFKFTPFKLCATATPAPNDWTELGTHAEFLGICTQSEMLAEYFIHDAAKTQDWRLKGHAKNQFWRWVASWAALVRKPSDLGFDDSMYELPALNIHQHTTKSTGHCQESTGMLFALEANTLSERRTARRGSLDGRVAECAEKVNASDKPWVIWCELNAEGDALKQAIPDAVEIRGSDDAELKESYYGQAARNLEAALSQNSLFGAV